MLIFLLLEILHILCSILYAACKGNVSQICGGSWRMNVYDSQDSDWVVGSSISAISEKIIPDENISDQIPEIAPISTTAPIYTTEMILFDYDSELATLDEIIRYSDAGDIFMLLSNGNEHYEYYQENHDYYDNYNVDDEHHSYFMHIKSDYAFIFGSQATNTYNTNSTMITVPDQAFSTIQTTTTTTVSTTTTTTTTAAQATTTTLVKESLVDDLMNITIPAETTEPEMFTTTNSPSALHTTPWWALHTEANMTEPLDIVCSPIHCDVTEWISKDKPTGTGDHERFK